MRASPDIFPNRPAKGSGVRRVNRRPLAILMFALAAIMGVVGYTALQRSEQARMQPSDAPTFAPVENPEPLDRAPEAGLIAESVPERIPSPGYTAAELAVADDGERPPSETPDHVAQSRAQERWQERLQRLEERRLDAAVEALAASPSAAGTLDGPRRPSGPQSLSPDAGAGVSGFPSMDGNPLAGVEDLARSLAGQQTAALGAGAPPSAAALAQQRIAWMEAASSGYYLDHARTPARSSFELKAGTVLPSHILFGINSDLPGQVVAQIRENVYDSVTGKHLLIPQGTRAVGAYDSSIELGQARLLVGWDRLIYPDGSSLELDRMPGADQAGAGGLADKVNRHTGRVFGNALLFSLFSAGAQLSQPDAAGAGAYDSKQVLAAALGQQLGQAGIQMIQQNMNVQPTLTIRPGLRFNIVLTKDVVLAPYRPMLAMAASK